MIELCIPDLAVLQAARSVATSPTVETPRDFKPETLSSATVGA